MEFVAKSNGFNGEGEGFSELGSEKEFENKAWFALSFSRKAMTELAKNGITDLGYYVEDKVVATGVVKEIDFGTSTASGVSFTSTTYRNSKRRRRKSRCPRKPSPPGRRLVAKPGGWGHVGNWA